MCSYLLSLVFLIWYNILLHQNLNNCARFIINCVYLQNMFTNHIFDIYVKTGFGIKQPRMVDMP